MIGPAFAADFPDLEAFFFVGGLFSFCSPDSGVSEPGGCEGRGRPLRVLRPVSGDDRPSS